jgi:hypothetical protein
MDYVALALVLPMADMQDKLQPTVLNAIPGSC